MNDTISRQAAINELEREAACGDRDCEKGLLYAVDVLELFPSAQPEITDEKAIEHLQSSGWMQNHDKQMYEMGLKEQLADDSGSYDALLPSAQLERKKGRWIAHVGGKFVGFPYMHYECDQCRAFKPTETNFCPDCGADMREVMPNDA